jgi:exoribonuclease R
MEPIAFEPISFEPISFEPISFELNVYDRNYEKYVFINTKDLQEDINCPNPLSNKWFHKDIIDESGKVIKSPYMNNDAIPGVLIINGNTYGHLNGDLKAKLLYKCIPDDKSLPIFLIPYEYKCNTFNKNKHNKYVTFRIKEWIDKHPIGIITNIFGNVNENESFYKYQLCCKNLNNSISGFNKATINSLKIIEREKITQQLSTNLEDRRMYEIFSIDPYGSKDIDDAMGIRTIEGKLVVSIYIANVALVLDHLNLWDYFSKRISSIYLPNVKIHMLPNILSDDLCSLIESQDRCAYCMDVLIDEDNTISITLKSVIINVKKNYVYEEKSLLDNIAYLNILKISRTLNINYKYVNSIDDSHHVVEFFMILMNYEASKLLLERKSGIFRITTENNICHVKSCVPTNLCIPTNLCVPTNIRAIINNISGSYCTYENVRSHSLIGEGLDSYVHITSPIRRLVDLCNMIELQTDIMSDKAKDFAKSWMSSIDDINAITKNIRKVQNNCNLLSLYTKEGLKKYTGIIFNKNTYKEDILKFSIYIPDLKMISTLKTREKLENYSNVVVSTHIFVDEDNIMKKIRLQIA